MSSDRLHYKAGDIVFSEGDPSTSVYFMLSGRIKVTRRHNDREIELAEMSHSTILGETGVICGRPRTATITALEATTMLRTDANVFKELLHQVPQVTVALARELALRVDATSERLLAATFDHTE